MSPVDRSSDARPELVIRDCAPGDYAAVAEIFSHWIREGGATMDTLEKTPRDIADLVESMNEREALMVLQEEGGGIAGWGIVKRYTYKLGYRVCAETSVFLRPDRLRGGFGTILKRAVIERCRELGYHHLIARIWADNESSIEYNKRLGYEVVGVQREIGHCHGAWRDICIMQLVLDDVPPWRPELGLPVAPGAAAADGAKDHEVEGAGPSTDGKPDGGPGE